MGTRSFEELDIYKKCCQLRKKIFELSKTFPSSEKYLLVDQLVRSTRKCPANIAEGHGRFHYQENIQFCRIARGSLAEAQDHLNCACECEYISVPVRDELKKEIQTIIRMINGYIKYLSTKKKAVR